MEEPLIYFEYPLTEQSGHVRVYVWATYAETEFEDMYQVEIADIQIYAYNVLKHIYRRIPLKNLSDIDQDLIETEALDRLVAIEWN